jgi:serralysin
MAITIRLTATEGASKGVNYDRTMKTYFADFAFRGWPYILGGAGPYEGTEIVLLDNLAGRNTKSIVLDGRAISYNLASHVVSGTLTTVRLGTLGESFKAPDAFTQDGSGRIVDVAAPVRISGLTIAGNEFHELVSGLMGGVSSGHRADPSVLKAALADEAHNLLGSSGNDVYTGTRFGDRISGKLGNDTLAGGAGHDRIVGDDGNDKLTGGLGADDLRGGAGADAFIFKSVKDTSVAKAGRDTIFDFSLSRGDKIHLRTLDADTTSGGNQAFSFVGTKAFSGDAGELRYVKAKSDTFIYGDVNGDRIADFAIHLDDRLALSAGDFVL